jgi:hypothetical protein
MSVAKALLTTLVKIISSALLAPTHVGCFVNFVLKKLEMKLLSHTE